MNEGKNCTVQPLRKRKQIIAIKQTLANNPRDLALFQVGINSGLRGSDLLKLRWIDAILEDGKIKRTITVKESKTGKTRRIAVSDNMRAALTAWLGVCCGRQRDALDRYDLAPEDLMFPSRVNGLPMSIQRLHQLVNNWTARAGIEGHFGSHTLRKTYGYHLRKRGADLPTLMKIFGHANQAVTLRYIGVDEEEVDEANLRLNL